MTTQCNCAICQRYRGNYIESDEVICLGCSHICELPHPYFGNDIACHKCKGINGKTPVIEIRFDEGITTVEPEQSFGADRSIKWKLFDYVFKICNENKIPVSKCGSSSVLSIGDLTDTNILSESVCYAYQIGKCGGEPWVLIVKRPDKNYVYYFASMNADGFNNLSKIKICYSNMWISFWNFALDDYGRDFLQ